MRVLIGITAVLAVGAIACLVYLRLALESPEHLNSQALHEDVDASLGAASAMNGGDAESKPVVVANVDRIAVEIAEESEERGELVALQLMRGLVVDAQRIPVDSAHVSIAGKTTETDERGEFQFQGSAVELSGALVVAGTGWEPMIIEGAFQLALQTSPERFEVILVSRPLSIAGRLLDASGKPCATWNLELKAGTASGMTALPSLLAEDFSAGALFSPTSVHGPDVVMNPNSQTIGKNGEFVVRGLRRGVSYVLRAWNESTLEDVVSPPVIAGTKAYEFVVPTTPMRPRVDGFVHSRWGVPLKGVRVRLTMRVYQSARGSSFQTGQEVTTGADGRFVFVDVPKRPLLIRFTGKSVRSLYREFPGDEQGQGIDVLLETNVKFRFEANAGHESVDCLELLDGTGEVLRMTLQVREGVTKGLKRASVVEGSSPELMVSDKATTMRLFRSGKIVSEFSVRILPGAVQLIRY